MMALSEIEGFERRELLARLRGDLSDARQDGQIFHLQETLVASQKLWFGHSQENWIVDEDS